MKKLFLIFLLLPLFLFAQTSVWKVEKNGNTVYIGGTIHLLRNSDYPLPKQYDKAYHLSDKLYFETDLSTMNEPEFQQKMLGKMMLPKGQKLSNVLSKDVYKKLEKFCKTYSINIKEFESFKPIMPVLLLTIAELKTIGVNESGIDTFYENKAYEDGKMVGELETVRKHIDFITSMGEGNENQFVIQSLKDLKRTKELFNKMITSWRSGDTKTMDEFFNMEMKRESPKLYQTLLIQRNNNWLPKIKKMFQDKKIEFVLVGAAHLVGKDGLIQRLKKDGYRIEKLK